jgi:ABC-2 type transport system permease protein
VKPARLSEAIVAEWGKTWSLRAPSWCVTSAVVLTVGTAFTLANDFEHDVATGVATVTTMSVSEALAPSVQLGQLALVALAMLLVASEYASGSIRSTFLARPQRGDVLAAKTLVTTMIGLVAGAAAATVGWAVTHADLGAHATAESSVSVIGRIALMVAAACAMTSALASMLRSSAGTLTAAFVLLVGLDVISGPIGSYTPAGAAMAFMTGDSTAYPYGVGGLVMCGWAVVAYVVARLLLVRRDA